jgi:hypothetical protein
MQTYLQLTAQEMLLEQEYYILDALNKNILPMDLVPLKENFLSKKAINMALLIGGLALSTFCIHRLIKNKNETKKRQASTLYY